MDSTIKQQIKDILKKSINADNADVGYTRFSKFGDYSTSTAIDTAKLQGLQPQEVATDMAGKIKSGIFEKVEAVPQGFINFFLSKKFVLSGLAEIIKLKDRFGVVESKKPKNIILEFVSANPTGPMNVVSARQAAVGDCIANLLKLTSNKVFKEYYINDAGNQIETLGKSALASYKKLLGEDAQFPEDGYQGEYINDIAKKILDEEKDNIPKDEVGMLEFFVDYSIRHIVSGQKKDLEDFRVKFDNWYSELELNTSGKLQRCFEVLKSNGEIYVEEGKSFFKSTKYGDDKDRVFMRADGTSTYFLRDAAYHLDKFDRKFDLAIDILGPDHHSHIARMTGVVKALGIPDEKFMILTVQQVNLIEKGQKVKMSKREGKFVTLNELIKEVGVDAARYFFVLRTLSSHLDFDIELAKKQSDENPVYYVQYAHARICSIFSEAEKRGISFNPEDTIKQELLEKEEELALAKLLLRFPDTILEASDDFKPNKIPEYLHSVAVAFHKFYTECHVLSENKDLTSARLLLIYCVRIVLKNSLDIIGVKAPERM